MKKCPYTLITMVLASLMFLSLASCTPPLSKPDTNVPIEPARTIEIILIEHGYEFEVGDREFIEKEFNSDDEESEEESSSISITDNYDFSAVVMGYVASYTDADDYTNLERYFVLLECTDRVGAYQTLSQLQTMKSQVDILFMFVQAFSEEPVTIPSFTCAMLGEKHVILTSDFELIVALEDYFASETTK